MDAIAQMATFVRIVDGKSLSAAARAQRLSLPAVSRQLRALEAGLGTTLIVRSTRRLHITDAGRQWYAHCVRILRELEDARAAVGGERGVRGTVLVSASLTFGSVVIVPLLARLTERHPHLTVDLRLEDHLVDLVAEGVDVAVRAGPPPPDSTAFVAQPLFAMQRLLVAAPRWLRAHGAPREPSQLVRHACLVQVTPAGVQVRWQLRRDDAEHIVDVRGPLRSNAPSALRELALDGVGIAYLPDWLVAEDIARGRLRRVLPEWASAPVTAWAVYRAELRGVPRVRAFIDALPRVAPASPVARTRRRAGRA
jgi:DNA-binding transcriptional LysR family regulator